MRNVGPIDNFVWWPADYDSSRGVPHKIRYPSSVSPGYENESAWPYIDVSGRFVVLLLGYGAMYASATGPPLSDPNHENHQRYEVSLPEGEKARHKPAPQHTHGGTHAQTTTTTIIPQGEEANVAYRWWAPKVVVDEDEVADEATEEALRRATKAARPPDVNVEKDLTIVRPIYGNLESILSQKSSIPPEFEGTQHRCSERMFVEFTAARDIDEGEVLTIDLTVDEGTRHRHTTLDFSQYCL
jgi:hypothetical protein